ncbi:MAG: tetratricopeptide repeat protein [Bdellovibrionaceae bacterium]|nr:tetratricopeptide repeat protein [Bdellovibrionales bacterium]MCB9082812.1 tetratricopeptide repeat protein [Pseudobdellovibrionaceae bacterium]
MSSVRLSILFAGCFVLLGVNEARAAKPKSAPVNQMTHQQQQQQTEDLKNQALVLKELAKGQHKGQIKNPVRPTQVLNNQVLFDHKKNRMSKEFAKLTEKQLYSKAIDSFRGRDAASLRAASSLLKTKYPKSAHVDNALYLDALLLMQNEAYNPAIRRLEEVIKQHPKGNKRVAALFAKGVIYKRLNLIEQSRLVLAQVIKEYPGSPESQRAAYELRLLGKNNN